MVNNNNSQVSFVCSVSDPELVMIAAVMTLGITASLTYYALTTKTDFTMMGASLFIFGMALMLFGLFLSLFQSRLMNILYSVLGVILYGFYLVYDIQLLVGGRDEEFDMDDYVIASIQIYLDVVLLFLKILEILNEIMNKKD
jgi:hypothetical protein